MTDENVLQTIQKFLQEILAPDLRQVKLEIALLREQEELRYQAIMASLRELKAQMELHTMRQTAALAERVAMLEAKQR